MLNEPELAKPIRHHITWKCRAFDLFLGPLELAAWRSQHRPSPLDFELRSGLGGNAEL
jgi:hypothetical protein